MIRVVWQGGGEAELVALEGDGVTLSSTVPFPPGARVLGALPDKAEIRLKVHASRKAEIGFEVRGRLLDVRKEVRQTLERALCDDAGFKR